MKKLIIYYSYSGHTKAIAQELADKELADIIEVEDKKRPGKLKAYSLGCLAAIRGKSWSIKPLDIELTEYESFILMTPVWAGNPAPAFNSLIEALPDGKPVSIKMISGSGKSDCKERLETILGSKGCALEGFEDIKA